HSRRDGRGLAPQGARRKNLRTVQHLPSPRLRRRPRPEGRLRLPLPRQPVRDRRIVRPRPLAPLDGPAAGPRRGGPGSRAGLAVRDRRQRAEADLIAWFAERVPGGARWAYVFGSALVFLLLAQFASGLALAMSYSASVPAAWASVARIEQSGLGHLVR